ncbi:hypothetical protein SAMN04488134_104132 [Amphibacillus marinus]|uniref:Uncharacterized protein n=1 Tax=Amphibacillus marinus TaxID=872970 RepID=A0A1H8MEN6_9BACI|nr:hypothetical protein [Amphibacillus marinus]SEO15882.1 hypothetical protein SAMN04488134_104132 [Amphibacillus marinus]
MSGHYHTCCQNIGRPVSIRTVDGREHRGVIRNVTQSHVYLEPFGGRPTGHSWGYWGWGAGSGFGLGIALGAIGTLAILPWFFI